jgi:2-dehydropantoate 2-reductase
MRHGSAQRVGVSILKEALQLVDKADIRLEPLPDISIAAFRLVASLPPTLASWLLKKMMTAKNSAGVVTSTLQSLRRGRKTEIDYLNGEFVKLGERLGIPAPMNERVVELIHEIEAGGSFYSPDELARVFSV